MDVLFSFAEAIIGGVEGGGIAGPDRPLELGMDYMCARRAPLGLTGVDDDDLH